MNISALKEWNPWWENTKLLDKLKGFPRNSYETMIHSLNIREITIILGIRRSGKSTLMYQMIDTLIKKGTDPDQILFVNLEDNKLKDFDLENIYSSYRENINPEKKAYIFLDEIHRKEQWESWLRKQYDLKADCKFIISGSCSYLLRKEFSTLLTGRNITFEVFPLSFSEYLEFKSIDKKHLTADRHKIINSFMSFMIEGGFPEIFFKEKEFKSKVLSQYFDDILYKDIVDRHNITSKKVKDLALYLITNFTSQVSLRNLRNTLGLSYDTTKDYLSYFEDAFLFFILDHFSYSVKEQKTLPSKTYCIDNGLRNSVSFRFSKDEGRLAENLAFIELKRRNKDIYYWVGKNEVDFVIKEKDNTLTAINVSYSEEISQREIDSLLEFKQNFNNAKGLIMLTKNTEKKQHGIEFIPLWKWLL